MVFLQEILSEAPSGSGEAEGKRKPMPQRRDKLVSLINPPIQHVRLWQDLLNGRDTGQWLLPHGSPAACSHGGLQQSLQHDGKGQLSGVPVCIVPMVTSGQGPLTSSLAFFSVTHSIAPAGGTSLFKSEKEEKKMSK